jgi:hypothetical protein
MLTEMTVTKQAAFITGRILHRGTGLPIKGKIQIKARDVPIVAKVLDDGTFAISGAINQIFPTLDSQAYKLKLTIQAESVEFRRGMVEYSQLVDIRPDGISFDPDAVEPFRSLIDLGNIYLPVDPAIDSSADPTVYQDNLLVEIRGRILQAKKPEENFPTPPTVQVVVDGAAPIEVVANADGRYRFSSIVMRLPAEIRCSAPGFQPIKRPLLVDFGKVVNQEDFRLLSI